MNRFRLALVVGLSAVPAFASSPDPKALEIPPTELSRARALVQQLGSDLFRERENAQAELNKMGRLAKPVLSDAAVADPDPEVRVRAGRLLSRATADDLKARIDTFLADTDGKFEHNLPGWSHFRKAVGGDKAARDLFVEILKTPANMELLSAVDRSNEAGGRAIADRRYSLYTVLNRRFQGGLSVGAGAALTVPDIATLLLAELVIESRHIPQAGPFRFVNGASFLQQHPALGALTTTGTPHADTFKKLVSGWLETRVDPQELGNLTYLLTSQLRGFKEAVPVLRRIATTEGVSGWARGQAVSALVRDKGKDEIPMLKGMMKDEGQLVTVFLGNAGGVVNNPSLQVRDMALAHLLTLHGQDMKDYGFEFPQGTGQVLNASSFGSYAFVTDDARKAAFKKWDAWEKARPKVEEKK